VCFSWPGSRLAASAPFGLSPRAYLEVSGSLLLVAVGDVPPASNAEFSQLTNVAMQNWATTLLFSPENAGSERNENRYVERQRHPGTAGASVAVD
ncbi:MAG: hypothetical protein WCE49_18985, partial [Terrimicrobiaceae bacterium]